MKSLLKTLGMVCLFGMAACQNSQPAFKSVDAATFEQQISAPEVQLVDVRTPDEYAAGHIAESKNIDSGSADFEVVCKKELDSQRPVAVYCRSGRRSKIAAEQLTKMGFQVVELNGGFNEWKESNRTVVQ